MQASNRAHVNSTFHDLGCAGVPQQALQQVVTSFPAHKQLSASPSYTKLVEHLQNIGGMAGKPHVYVTPADTTLSECRTTAGMARHPLSHRGPRRMGCAAELRAAVAQAVPEPRRIAQHDHPGAQEKGCGPHRMCIGRLSRHWLQLSQDVASRTHADPHQRATLDVASREDVLEKREAALQVPSLVFGGGSPPDGDPKVMIKQPEDPESWSVQVLALSTAFCILQCSACPQ